MSKKFHATLNRLVEQSANNNPRRARRNGSFRARRNGTIFKGVRFATRADAELYKAYLEGRADSRPFSALAEKVDDLDYQFETPEDVAEHFNATPQAAASAPADKPKSRKPDYTYRWGAEGQAKPGESTRVRSSDLNKYGFGGVSKRVQSREDRTKYLIPVKWWQYKLFMMLAQLPPRKRGTKEYQGSLLRYNFIAQDANGIWENPFKSLDQVIRGQKKDFKNGQLELFFDRWSDPTRAPRVPRYSDMEDLFKKLCKIPLPESFVWESQSVRRVVKVPGARLWGPILQRTSARITCRACSGMGCQECGIDAIEAQESNLVQNIRDFTDAKNWSAVSRNKEVLRDLKDRKGKKEIMMWARPGIDKERGYINNLGDYISRKKVRLPYRAEILSESGDSLGRTAIDRRSWEIAARIAFGTFLVDVGFTPGEDAELVEQIFTRVNKETKVEETIRFHIYMNDFNWEEGETMQVMNDDGEMATIGALDEDDEGVEAYAQQHDSTIEAEGHSADPEQAVAAEMRDSDGDVIDDAKAPPRAPATGGSSLSDRPAGPRKKRSQED